MPSLTPDEHPRTDLATRADIEDMLRRFYGRVLVDDLLAGPFAEIRESGLESHLPIMYDFWETVLFGTHLYQGRALRVHRSVHTRHRLEARHFLRWLTLWSTTVGQMFHGPIAAHATGIARAMHRNLTGTDSAELDALTTRLHHRVRDDHPTDRSPGGDLDDRTASHRRAREATDLPETHHNPRRTGQTVAADKPTGVPASRTDASAVQDTKGSASTVNQKTWSVNIVIDDHKSAETGAQTRASARLHTNGRATFVGTGLARRNSHHTDVPEVSDDMAAARALADLSHQLYEAAAQREAVTRNALTSARSADFGRRRSSA
ncbi:dsRBD fold-containing protein [Rhodococcus opacus]|uniref:dsRBD fold-containing protein n=1 Tax=Rhodococcus opacus TaxID=37919 RepID=UPI001F56A8D3|nr:dsRBD fold-containing protein [Rhodococcus opacus]UNN04946.1 DUF1876 family protein [Rhodococcus opacus]